MSFGIDCTNTSTYRIPTITIELIGYFSIDSDSQYRADLSQVKYYVPPSDLNNVNFDLKKFASTSTRRRSPSYLKLDNILRWISDNFNRLEKPLSAREECWLDVDFICHRRVLESLLCSIYSTRYEWIICASKYCGTIYLCDFDADHPSHRLHPSVHLIECEKFYCTFKTKFHNHLLLYAAEIDNILSQQPISNTFIGETFELIKLQIFPMDNSNGDIYGTVAPEKAIAWWSQNYLAGIKKIICGLKDKTSVVRMIKEYPTYDLPNLSKPFCNVDKCKIFCKMFLDNVKKIVTKDYNECIYKFHWKPSAKDVVIYSEEAPDNKKYFFLKPWFVDKAEEYRNRSQ